MSITILDPRAQPGVPVTPYELTADLARPALRVALVWNGFFDGGAILEAFAEALREHLVSPTFRLFARDDASVTADPEVIAEAVATSDLALCALGHCGSCTSSATRDAVAFARAGIPAAALVSDKFLESSGFVARAAGMPDIPRVRLPHPIAGTGEARIRAVAAAQAPALIAAWRGERVLADVA